MAAGGTIAAPLLGILRAQMKSERWLRGLILLGFLIFTVLFYRLVLVPFHVSDYFLDQDSANVLITFLKQQRAVTGCELPHRHHLLIEHVQGQPAHASFRRVILHTLWGSRVNYPLSLILEYGYVDQIARFVIHPVDN